MIRPVHWLDRLYGAWVGHPRLFPLGWGDLECFERLAGALEARSAPAELRPRVRDGMGTFESPHPKLPDASRVARFAFDHTPGARRALVVLAATGEEGYRRRRLWTTPLQRAGISCVLLENPYYGSRRPAGQAGTTLSTVAEAVTMGHAAVEEARALLAWLRRDGFEQVGVAGFSMGGSMAAFTAVTVPFPIACVSAATAASAAFVYCEGLLTRQIRWDRLGEGARERLAEAFDRVSLDRLPPPARAEAAVLLGCRRDGYVATEGVERLHRHWAGSELRWLGGGHVAGALASGRPMRSAVQDAFARLDVQPTGGAEPSVHGRPLRR